MSRNTLRRKPLSAGTFETAVATTRWLWNGYLHDGEITLLTSQWKTGKTTLVAGLLRALGPGGEFLGRSVRPGRAWVISEESDALWGSRIARIPIGEHAELINRPFRGKPSLQDWQDLIDDALEARWKGELDLFIIDPLISFLPGHSESCPKTMLEMLKPLEALTSEGMAVLILHHPRKKKSEPGASARGTGALLGFVDIVLELGRSSRLKSDSNQRTLFALSRRDDTPERLSYEWIKATGEFQPVLDPVQRQYEGNWQQMKKILEDRSDAATHTELLMDWPIDQERPSPASLYNWLNQATAEKRVRREGRGVSGEPWRYRLPNKADEYYDRGELPPFGMGWER